MGYTTTFKGQVNLSRKLTLPEARELLLIAEDRDTTKAVFGINAYLQWVPTESLDGIVWDGNEKFYEYEPLMQKVCEWLKARGIRTDGELFWSGEEAGDTGVLTVADGAVSSSKGKRPAGKSGKPLTLAGLGELALDQLTQPQ